MRYSYVPESDAAHEAYDPFKTEREPYPEPKVTSREVSAFPIPAPVMALAEFAREQGWEVRTQYAQGRPPHGSTGRPGALKDSIAVIFGGHPLCPGRQAYACYERTAVPRISVKPAGAWVWDGIVIRGADFPPYAGCGISELKAFLMMSAVTDGPALQSWISDLKEIAANGADLQKRRDVWRKEARAALNLTVGMTWPAALLAGAELGMALAVRGDTFYSPMEIEKLLNTRSRAAEKETAR